MSPASRKLLLTAHLVASIGWVGALAVFFAHAVAAFASHGDQIVRAASLAMGLTAWVVILPFSIATLGTGMVQALGTSWGLLRHYWIVFKLVLTAVATLVLLLKCEARRPDGWGHACVGKGLRQPYRRAVSARRSHGVERAARARSARRAGRGTYFTFVMT